MKLQFLLLIVLVICGTLTLSQAADSKRTAEYLLSSPESYEGKTVTVDVASVQPVHWKSPISELVFFHAMTRDRRDNKPGGTILVAVSAKEAAAFAKKYGTDFEGRNESDTLKGQFLSTGPRQVWVIDTSNQLASLLAKNRLMLPNEARIQRPGPPRK